MNDCIRSRWLAWVCLAALSGCVTDRPPPEMLQTATTVAIASPADDEQQNQRTSRSFFVRGNHFPTGQAALLRVCVTPQGTISTVKVVHSSGEARFDEFALVWAHQADVSNWVRKDQQHDSCGYVRVEIGPGRPRSVEQAADTALG